MGPKESGEGVSSESEKMSTVGGRGFEFRRSGEEAKEMLELD